MTTRLRSASKYLRSLEKLGILEIRKQGKEVLFLNRKLIGILCFADEPS